VKDFRWSKAVTYTVNMAISRKRCKIETFFYRLLIKGKEWKIFI